MKILVDAMNFLSKSLFGIFVIALICAIGTTIFSILVSIMLSLLGYVPSSVLWIAILNCFLVSFSLVYIIGILIFVFALHGFHFTKVLTILCILLLFAISIAIPIETAKNEGKYIWEWETYKRVQNKRGLQKGSALDI